MDSRFGNRDFDGDNLSFYSNFIYQDIFGDTRHKYKTGLSFQYDQNEQVVDINTFKWTHTLPGAFFEYTYHPDDKFTLVTGIRGDYLLENEYFIYSPRLHVRYAPVKNTVLRVSGGKGTRYASVFSEYVGMFASSRQIRMLNINGDDGFGLPWEEAWNMGGSVLQRVQLGKREMAIVVDYYYTVFEEQVIVDFDNDPRAVYIYPLDGRSFSSAAKIQMDVEVVKDLDLRLAYRYNDVKYDLLNGETEVPLHSKHRAFINAAYELGSWNFDATLSWYGPKRIPNTVSNPPEYQLDMYSPDFFLMNAQVAKKIGKTWQVYIGGENLLNYKQENAIIANNEPFSPYFDASMIWGPIFGRKVHAGVRYRIDR